jgi:N-acetyl-anhydromuramyl-L-alanine amidase AmpD
MYPFNDILQAKKKSPGINKCTWIVIHHTAWGTYKSNIKYLSSSSAKASVHFVIWENWEVAKIWDPRDILWHAWNWSWWWAENVNYMFMGIEVVWTWEYNIHQFLRLTDLVEYLMWNFPIDWDNIVRHSDVTQDRWITKQRILRDWNRKVKKIDIGLDFFVDNEHFKEWRNQLHPRTLSRFVNI